MGVGKISNDMFGMIVNRGMGLIFCHMGFLLFSSSSELAFDSYHYALKFSLLTSVSVTVR